MSEGTGIHFSMQHVTRAFPFFSLKFRANCVAEINAFTKRKKATARKSWSNIGEYAAGNRDRTITRECKKKPFLFFSRVLLQTLFIINCCFKKKKKEEKVATDSVSAVISHSAAVAKRRRRRRRKQRIIIVVKAPPRKTGKCGAYRKLCEVGRRCRREMFRAFLPVMLLLWPFKAFRSN